MSKGKQFMSGAYDVSKFNTRQSFIKELYNEGTIQTKIKIITSY